jgi:hypothetical protein
MSVPEARVMGSSTTVLPVGSPSSSGNTAATSVPARRHAASPWQCRAMPSWGTGFPGVSEKFCTLVCPTPGSESTPGSVKLVSVRRYVLSTARLPKAT